MSLRTDVANSLRPLTTAALIFLPFASTIGCGSPVSGTPCSGSESALREEAPPTFSYDVKSITTAPPPGLRERDSRAASCEVVLRTTAINFESALIPRTRCIGESCWVSLTATVDVATAEAAPELLYRGAIGIWHLAPAPVLLEEAPRGFRRYQFLLDQDTFFSGAGANSLQLAPFVVHHGARIFDGNAAASRLTPEMNWTLREGETACRPL